MNWQMNAIVFSIEADINFSNIDGTFTFANDDEFTTDVQLNGSLRGRLGYVFDRALVYATGGLAIADVEQGALNLRNTHARKRQRDLFGFTVGGGFPICLLRRS